MNEAIHKMLQRYRCATAEQYKSALKEIIQQLILLGMARAKFYEHGAFYGGTALRVFHGLDRYSEDVDFSLLRPVPGFSIDSYCVAIRDELSAFGFSTTVERRRKRPEHAKVQSAFVKANTLVHLMTIEELRNPMSGTHRNEKLSVKFEMDTDPPPGAGFEVGYLQEPIPFSVKLYDQPSMFAGKMHALLCRNLETVRIKGRDLYDVVWYLGHRVPVNLHHLEARLKQTGYLDADARLSEDGLRERFMRRIAQIDLARAREDVRPFLKDPMALDVWSPDFFHSLVDQLSVDGSEE